MQERPDRRLEILDVLRLLVLTAAGVSLAAFRIGRSRSLSRKIIPDPLDGCPRGPIAAGEHPAADFLSDQPVRRFQE